MSLPLVLLAMLWCHVLDDYVLQGILASLKQRDWWQAQLKSGDIGDTIYRHDYVAALLCHGLSWSCCVHLPLLLAGGLRHQGFLALSVALNALVHALVDHAKANWKCINLVQDQCYHVAQIASVLLVYSKACLGMW